MKKYLLVGAALAVLLPSVAFAQTTGLTSSQVSAIIGLLQAFGADQSVISNVEIDLGGYINCTDCCFSCSNNIHHSKWRGD